MSMRRFVRLHDRVIVKRLEAGNQDRLAASSFPTPPPRSPTRAKSLAVGNGKTHDDGKLRPLDVKVGDRVLFGKYSGQTVKVDGDELLVMREEDIMARRREVKLQRIPRFRRINNGSKRRTFRRRRPRTHGRGREHPGQRGQGDARARRAATWCSSARFGAPTVTKDGVSVAKEIELKDKFENMGAQMVKEVASKTSDVAGDGTTTATVLAQAIVREGMKYVAAGMNPMDLKRGIDKAVDARWSRS